MFRLGSVLLLLAARAALPCPDSDWVPTGDGDCYLPLPGETTAEDAKVVCSDFEATATLTEVHNDQDQITLDQLADSKSVWLGLYRNSEEDPWVWPDSDDSYRRWAPGQPDDLVPLGDCAFSQDGLWYNADCADSTHGVVCFTTEE